MFFVVKRMGKLFHLKEYIRNWTKLGLNRYGLSINCSIRWCFYFAGQVFFKKDQNHSPNSYQKLWRTNSLKTGALLGVISDIHRVRTNPEDPMDVGKDWQQGTCSNFQKLIWGVISILFEKTWPALVFFSFTVIIGIEVDLVLF